MWVGVRKCVCVFESRRERVCVYVRKRQIMSMSASVSKKRKREPEKREIVCVKNIECTSVKERVCMG